MVLTVVDGVLRKEEIGAPIHPILVDPGPPTSKKNLHPSAMVSPWKSRCTPILISRRGFANASIVKCRYLGEGNRYGDFEDRYLVENGFENPHKLHYTAENNPDPKPVHAINVTFEGVSHSSVDPVSGDIVPALSGPGCGARGKDYNLIFDLNNKTH